MYAVIVTGGKQYRVQEGDTLRVERLAAEEGASVEFDKVLMVGDGDQVSVGAPYVEGTKVAATVKSHGRAKKIKVVKFKRRKNYLRRQGHRQGFTELEITGIGAGGKRAAKPKSSEAAKPEAPAEPQAEAKTTKKATAKKATTKKATAKKTAKKTSKKTTKKKADPDKA